MKFKTVDYQIPATSPARQEPQITLLKKESIDYEVDEDKEFDSYLKQQLRSFFEDKGKFETISLSNLSLSVKIALLRKSSETHQMIRKQAQDYIELRVRGCSNDNASKIEEMRKIYERIVLISDITGNVISIESVFSDMMLSSSSRISDIIKLEVMNTYLRTLETLFRAIGF